MVNIWKVSTLALAGALAIVVGRGAVIQTSEACDTDADAAEQQSQVRLSAALSLLDRAEMQIRAATASRPVPRAKALEGIALVKFQVKKGLEPVADPPPPPHDHRMMKRAAPTATQAKFVRMSF